MVTRRTVAKSLAATPLAASALLHLDAGARRIALAQGEPVSIGSKNFTEQLILGEMYALLLENAGITPETRLNLGGTLVAHEALLAGEIDLYPEYTGTALTAILEIPIESVAAGTPVAGAATPADQVVSIDQQVYDIVSEEYRERFDLIWLDHRVILEALVVLVVVMAVASVFFSEKEGVN